MDNETFSRTQQYIAIERSSRRPESIDVILQRRMRTLIDQRTKQLMLRTECDL